MLSRFEREILGTQLPAAWLHEAHEIFRQTFQDELEKHKLTFKILGETYPDELCLAVGLFSIHEKQSEFWTTFMLSTSLEKNTPVEKSLDSLLNALGAMLDLHFSQIDDAEYVLNWQEEEFQKIKIHAKISHENLELSSEADKWLK